MIQLKANDIDITVEQWRILFYLWNKDGINQQELAKISNKEKSTITRQVETLEKRGFISRRSSVEDKRNKEIYVTAQGKAIKDSALKAANLMTQKAETAITEDELKVFKNVLHKMITNLK